MKTLIFITREENRGGLVKVARTFNPEDFHVFEGTGRAKESKAWDALMTAAHESPSRVFVHSISSIPGGPWNWAKQLARLGAVEAQVVSIFEPAFALRKGEIELLQVLVSAREAEIQARTRAALATARAAGKKIGRPKLQVPVADVVAARRNLSLRETARKYGVSPTSISRICAQAAELEARECRDPR